MLITISFHDAIAATSAEVVDRCLGAAKRLVERAARLDHSALVRFRSVGKHSLDVFVATPFDALVAQRIPGTVVVKDGVSQPQPVVNSADLARRWKHYHPTDTPELGLGSDLSMMWRGSLPPLEGYVEYDRIPGPVIRDIISSLAAESKQQAGPLGMPQSLLKQNVLTIDAPAPETAGQILVQGRHIAALAACGIATQPRSEKLSQYDFVRVASSGSWNRLDTMFGTLYFPRPDGLAAVP